MQMIRDECVCYLAMIIKATRERNQRVVERSRRESAAVAQSIDRIAIDERREKNGTKKLRAPRWNVRLSKMRVCFKCLKV